MATSYSVVAAGQKVWLLSVPSMAPQSVSHPLAPQHSPREGGGGGGGGEGWRGRDQGRKGGNREEGEELLIQRQNTSDSL